MKRLFFIALSIMSLTTVANDRLVQNVFKAAEREVAPMLDFTPQYQLEISDDQLIDNRGSLVDAIGVPGKIILGRAAWLDFYRQGIDVRLLVLHELLRSAGINDDDYVHSLPLMEELYATRDKEVTRRDQVPYCALRVAEFTFKEKTRRVRATGDSTPMTGGVIYFPNPFAEEATSNAVRNAKEECLKRGFESFRYKSGRVEMSSTQRNFKSESITRAHIRGLCVKEEPRKRKKKHIREERCSRAHACLNTVINYPQGAGKSVVIESATRQKEESCE